MEERRKTERIRLRVEISVYDIKTQEQVGRLVDISTEGIMLAGGQPMKINTVYEFRIGLPVSIYGKSELAFNAVCLWCGKVPGSSTYQAGFQIRGASREVRDLIKGWVENPGNLEV